MRSVRFCFFSKFMPTAGRFCPFIFSLYSRYRYISDNKKVLRNNQYMFSHFLHRTREQWRTRSLAPRSSNLGHRHK